MCGSNGDQFHYDYCITCSDDQLCRDTFLFLSCWSAGCDTDRDSRRNLFFYSWINNQCSDRSDHAKYKYSGNLYGYIYDGGRRRMCSTDGHYIGHDNNITCSDDQLCRDTFLFLSCWSAGCDTDRDSRRDLFFYSGINNQCSDRSDHAKYKYSGNLYGYIYDGGCRRMCSTDGHYIGHDNSTSGSYF
jgi:hypothetical protein